MKLFNLIPKILFVTLLIGFGSIKVKAQKLGFSYQAVAIDQSKSQGFGRDSQGEVLANKDISLRFSILEDSQNGAITYQETHNAKTDVFGIFRLVIGRGNNTSSFNLDDLYWGDKPYFMQVEIDFGDGFEVLGVEELLGSPYALNSTPQELNLNNNELSISKGNTVVLEDNSATNELITTISLNGSLLEITDAGGTKTADLTSLEGLDNSITNEIQDLQLVGNNLTITNNGTPTTIDLSPYLDNTNTQLTEAEVDGFVSNNGFLTTEVDGSVTNEIQDISSSGAAGNITLSSGSTLTLNVDDADASITNEIQDLNLTGDNLTITNNGSATTIDLSGYLDDTNTQLTEAEVDGFVSNNGYLTTEIDGSVTNEIQDISSSGAAGNITLSSGSTLTLNVDDADANITNEIQDLNLTGDNLTITNNGSATTIDLSGYLDDTNTQLTEAEVDAYANNNGYLTSESNSFATTGGVTSNSPGTISTDDFVFGSTQLDDDGINAHFNRMFFDKSKGAFRAGGAYGAEWDDANVGDYSFASGLLTTASGYNSSASGDGTTASGRNSFASGTATTASGIASFATGASTFTSGDYSFAAGLSNSAPSYSEAVFGANCTNYAPISASSFNAADRLFVIGNGVGSPTIIRSDALVMLKSGATTLNGELTIDADNTGGADGYTLPAQDGASGQVMTTDGSGAVSWNAAPVQLTEAEVDAYANNNGYLSSSDISFATAGGVTSNSPGNIATDDFVFGSPLLNQDGILNHYSRMFFDKSKSTFRAGWAAAAQWDNSNRGRYSVGFGWNTTASADFSVSMGFETIASGGGGSFAVGQFSVASGGVSTAMGTSTTASGSSSTAMGLSTTASGSRSSAMGQSTFARSSAETSIGSFNTDYTPNSALSFSSADRLFVVGNGSNSSARSDALILYKSGDAILYGQLTIDADNVGGSDGYTLPAQDGTSGQIMITDGAGAASWSAENNSFATTGGVTSNSPGTIATDDFVFGSTSLSGTGSRMFFDKSKGAFRAGIVLGTQWDDVNRGDYSTAMGRYSMASGLVSTAIGANCIASGQYSIAMARQSEATGAYAIALGYDSEATGNFATTIGGHTLIAPSYGETAMGLYSTIYTPNSTNLFDNADRILTIGNGTAPSLRSDALVIYKNGNATLAGSLTSTSDMRLKREITPMSNSLTTVLQLQGVHYKWNEVKPHDMESLQTGLIAQEVEKLLPELVTESSDGYKSINYIGLVPHLIEAIKTLQTQQEASLKETNQHINALEERLTKLEQLLEAK